LENELHKFNMYTIILMKLLKAR